MNSVPKSNKAGANAGVSLDEINANASPDSDAQARKAAEAELIVEGQPGDAKHAAPDSPAETAEDSLKEASAADVAETSPPVAPASPSHELTIAQLKEKIMATTPGTEQAAETMSTAMNDVQNRAKAAYEKGSETMTELSDLAKGNVEALVESSKILASGMQELGRTYAEEAKVAYEQMTSDLKELAAIKSPTELFQLQSKIMRRNFDMLVATSSKNTEAMMKLANEAFAPLSGRMNVAAEKVSKVS